MSYTDKLLPPVRQASFDLQSLQMRSPAHELLNGFRHFRHPRVFGSLPGSSCVSSAILLIYGARVEGTTRPTCAVLANGHLGALGLDVGACHFGPVSIQMPI